MDIVALANRLISAVAAFAIRAKRFFYTVALSGQVCPTCGGRLIMIAESRCQCTHCGRTFDPTLTFQRCSGCGGKPELRVRRYRCSGCGADVASRFVFEGLVFDAAYFRQKMTESRQRSRERRERVRQMLAESRSGALNTGAADLGSIPGLVTALNSLSAGEAMALDLATQPAFNLQRYEGHLRAHIGPEALCFDDIPRLDEDRRRDRIWRFVALIFMTQAGAIDMWQEGRDIMVVQHETH